MSKIMYKGVEYADGTNYANEIQYDNSNSGLSATDVQGAIDEVNSELNPYLYTDWVAGAITNNSTWVEKMGNLVIVHLYCVCIPSDKPTLISGLPIPKKNISSSMGSTAPSIVYLSTAGSIVIASPGTGSGVASIMSGTISYFTDY